MPGKSDRESARISFDLPLVPHALRAFIEHAVRDERFMLAFVESPGTALRAAGVPIQMDCLDRRDCRRLIQVIGSLRNMVASGAIARDFRFEQVFTVSRDVAYQEEHSSTETYAHVNFDHSTEGQTAENKTSSEGGIKDNFSKAGIGRPNVDDIFAPLISPGDLAAIATMMQGRLRTMSR